MAKKKTSTKKEAKVVSNEHPGIALAKKLADMVDADTQVGDFRTAQVKRHLNQVMRCLTSL